MRNGRWIGCLVFVVLVLSSCGVGDRANFESGVSRLRSQVQRIVDDSKAELAGRQGLTASSVQQTLRKHVPVPPLNLLFSDTADGSARVAFAIDDQIDNYGPGARSLTLRMCVLVAMAPSPELNTSITDTDCTAVEPKTDTIVTFKD